MNLNWMAWTWPTASIFIAIAVGVLGMTVWQLVSPSVERRNALGLLTTRGDRFFVAVLGTAIIEMTWLGLVGDHYPMSALVCLLYAVCVFRWY